MIILPIALIILAIFIIIYKKSKGKIYKDISILNSDEELFSNFLELSKCLGLPKKQGHGIDIKTFEKRIKRAKNIINRKKSKKNCILEFENIYFQNYYLFENILKNTKNQLYFVPHNGNVPRIVIFARALISLSKCKVDKNRLDISINGFLENAELSFVEIENLKDAILFTLIEKVNEIADVIISFRRLERASKSVLFIRRNFLDSDIFVYFLKKYNRPYYLKIERQLIAYGRSCDDVFYNVVLDYKEILENIVESIRNIDNSTENIVTNLKSYKILDNLSFFQNGSIENKNKILRRIYEISNKENILEEECAKNIVEKYGENAGFYLLERESIKNKAKNTLKDTVYLLISFFTLPIRIVINIYIFFKTLVNLKSHPKK